MKVKSVKIAKLPSFPDFDTDVPQSKRQEIREYLTWRWGEDHVCGIGTFSRLQPKGALADLSKVFGVPYQDAKKISKIIETVAMSKEEDISWSDLIQEAGGELAEWAERYPELFDNIQKFVGLTRQSSTHAAGKVISNVPLLGNLPLRVKNGEVVTQFDADDIEELGYIKYDILGIRHLDTLMNTDEMVHGKIDLDRFYDMTDEQYADKDVWKDFERGDTLGTFQAECLHEDTEVNGVPIRELFFNPPSHITSFDEQSESFVSNDVIRVYDCGEKDIYKIDLEDGRSIKCGPEHPLLTLNRGWVRAVDLNSEDEVYVSEMH